MPACSLTFYPYRRQPFAVELMEDEKPQSSAERNAVCLNESNSVFSDLTYELRLEHGQLSDIKEIHVYVNDSYEISTFSEGLIRFPGKGGRDRNIFIDCYGFVQISLVIILEDQSERHLHTNYFPVLVKRGELNDTVKSMVRYVYDHQELLLLNGEAQPKDFAGLKDGGFKSLSAQIILIEEIAAIYESSFGYFKANARFHIEKTAVVDRLEKLQCIDPATVRYIVQHPEQLKRVNSSAGIRIAARVYHPQKALAFQNACSYDIYENKVILGFLYMVVSSVAELGNRCRELLEQIPHEENYSREYVYSSFIVFSETRRMLEKGIERLDSAYSKLIKLLGIYGGVFPFSPEPMVCFPKPTAIFMAVPQYNRMFIQMRRWFKYGIYNFSKETFMLSFIKISALYESYILAKLIEYFLERDYRLLDSRRCSYPTSLKSKYTNTQCRNTFVFCSDTRKITLYYQPVVYDADRSQVNGIGLYRNNTISLHYDEDEKRTGHYYVPDFLIKTEQDGKVKYIIMDAKFSTLPTVRHYYVPSLAYKYLFSISPIHKNEQVSGLCIVYGQRSMQDQMESVYDKQLPDFPVHPFAETMPFSEEIAPELQFENLDRLLFSHGF